MPFFIDRLDYASRAKRFALGVVQVLKTSEKYLMECFGRIEASWDYDVLFSGNGSRQKDAPRSGEETVVFALLPYSEIRICQHFSNVGSASV